jgi:hypothetical protein
LPFNAITGRTAINKDVSYIWSLVHVLLLLIDKSKPYQIDFNQTKNLRSVQHHLFFVPVNLYCSIEKATLQHMKRLATVDESGFPIYADIHGPTIIQYRISSNKHPPTQQTTKKKRKGGRNNKMSSVRKLKHHTVNLYINSDFPCPYQHSIDCKSENESSKCLVYPASHTLNPHLLHHEVLVAERRRYYVLLKKSILSLQQFMDHSVMRQTDYDNLLEQHCCYSFTLLQVDTTMAIRFVSVSCGEFESLNLWCCELFPSHSFQFELSNSINIMLVCLVRLYQCGAEIQSRTLNTNLLLRTVSFFKMYMVLALDHVIGPIRLDVIPILVLV